MASVAHDLFHSFGLTLKKNNSKLELTNLVTKASVLTQRVAMAH